MFNQDSSDGKEAIMVDDHDNQHQPYGHKHNDYIAQNPATIKHTGGQIKRGLKNKEEPVKRLRGTNTKSKMLFSLLQYSADTNITNWMKKLSQLITSSGYFWCLVAACTIVEPILCASYPQGSNLLAQKVVLIASSVLFVIQLVGVATTEWESILSTQTGIKSEVFTKKVNEMTLFKILIFFAAEGEYIWEFTCLAIGWIFIFTRPGIAILRCFRVFRLLWYCISKIFFFFVLPNIS